MSNEELEEEEEDDDEEEVEVVPLRPVTIFRGKPTARPRFVPSYLPEWQNLCGIEEKIEPNTVDLTEENAHNFAGISSIVGWKGRVDYALNYLEKDTNMDASFLSLLLESVISTVILLSSEQPVPDNYMISSYMFLRYIRNEFGMHPPNIAGLLEHMKAKASKPVLTALNSIQDTDAEDLPKNVVITQVPKAVQERLWK